MLFDVKLIKEVVVGEPEVISESFFSLLLGFEVEDKLREQLLYDLFGQEGANSRNP